MKKIGLVMISLLLATAMPALAVRYGVKKQISLGGTGPWPSYLCYSPQSDRMYSGNAGFSNVASMSCADDNLLGVVSGTGMPAKMVYDSVHNRVYYMSGNMNFYAIDCASDTASTPITSQQGATSSDYNPVNNKIYFDKDFPQEVSIYDASSYTYLGSLTNYYGAVYYCSANNSVYSPALYAYDTLGAFSGATNSLIKDIYVPGLSSSSNRKMACNPAASRMYISLPNTDRMAILNTSTNGLVGVLNVGDNPNNFALCPVNGRMFIACNGSSQNSLYYIDGSDALDSVAVGDSVSTVVYNPTDSLIYIGCWQSGYVKLVDPRQNPPTLVDSILTYSSNFMDMSVDKGGDVYCALYNAASIYVIGKMPRRMWQSTGSGNWSSYINWNYSDDKGASWMSPTMMETPDCLTDSLITIDSTHTIMISGQAEYLDQVVVKAGANLTISAQATLGDTTGYDLDVDGTLMVSSGGDLNQSGQIRFGPYSQYIHGVDGDTIPAADWDSLSSIDILGMRFTQPSGLDQNFGTVIWDGASQEIDMTLAGETGFSCRNLTVNGTGLARMFICSTTNHAVTIPGNLMVYNGGTNVQIGSTGGNVVRVGRQFYVNSAIFGISDSSTAAVDTLILEGGYQNEGGSVRGGAAGSATLVFAGDSAQSYGGAANEMYGAVDIVVRPGATLDVQQGSTLGSGSAGSFNLMPGATLKVRDDAGFGATGTGSGAIQVNGIRSYSKQANYYYGEGPGGYVYSGDGLPDTVNMLTIDNQAGSMNGWYLEYNSITVTDTFSMLAGYIEGMYPITINGPVVWGSGYLNGSLPVTVGGSGPDIVLPTASGITLPTLTIDRPGRTVTLTAAVNISDTLYLNNGAVSTIGYGGSLTIPLGATVQRASGWVKGSLSKFIDTGTPAMVYELGNDSGYAPVTMTFDSVPYPDYLTISSIDGTHPSVDLPSNCLQRYWQINQATQLGFTGSATFSYLPSDFNTGFNEAAQETTMVVGGYNNSFGYWELSDIGVRVTGGPADGGTIEITGLVATAMFKKKTDLGNVTEFTLARDLRALRASKMWQLSGTANFWNSGFWLTSTDGGQSWGTVTSPDSFPTYLDSTIIIQPGADVTINMDLTLDQVIDSGTVYLASGNLTIADDPGTDPDFSLVGSFSLNGGTINANGTIQVSAGASYYHYVDGGVIPAATWDSLSTLNIHGMVNTAPSGLDQAFGSIVWDCISQTADAVLPGGPAFAARNLEVANTGSGNLYLTSSAKPEVILNDCRINYGTAILGAGGPRNLHVKNDFTVNSSAWLYLTDTLNAGIDTLFLYGSYTHTAAGIGGGGPDSTTIVFGGADTQRYSAGSEVLTGHINYLVRPGAFLLLPEMGTLGQGSQGDFTLMAGATLGIPHLRGIYPTGQDTGAILVAGTRSYSPGANYYYFSNQTGPYYTGPGLPDTVNRLSVDGMDNTLLSKDVAVMDTLSLLGNFLRMNNHRLTLFGPINENGGYLQGDSLSQLVIMGGNTQPVTLPSMVRDLGLLNINRPATVTMSDTMLIYQRLELVNGVLSNPIRLSFLNGASIYRSGNGSLAGAGSVVFVNQVGLEYAGGTITAGPEMPAGSMAIMYLAVKNLNDTLIVDRDTLNVWNSLSLSGGLRFNGRAFGSYGLLDTVGPAGELILTDTSRANFFGSVNPLYLPGITGGRLTLDNSTGGSVMRRNITCTGPLNLSMGNMVVGGNMLTMGDSLTGSGLLVTDSTSSLVFQGNAVTQAVPSTVNNLRKLSWDRPGIMNITAALVLYDTLHLGQGVVNNTGILTLRPGLTIIRNSGTLMNIPSREGPTDVVYGTHSGGNLNSGYELYGSASDINNVTVGSGATPADTLVLVADVQINGKLTLLEGAFNLGTQTLTCADTIEITAGRLLADTASGIWVLNCPYQFTLPTNISNLNNLTLESPAGMTVASPLTVRNTYTQISGHIVSGQLQYGPTGTLDYFKSGYDTTSDLEFPATNGPYNLMISTGNTLFLHAGRTIPGTLTLGGSPINTGANTLTMDTTGTVAVGAGFVEGRLAKLVPTGVDTTITFELGTAAGGQSPVDVEVFNNTVPAFVTAGIRGTGHPLTNDSLSSLKKYWTLDGAIGADASLVTLHYLNSYFNPPNFTELADESTMVAGRYDVGGTPGWYFPAVTARGIGGTSDGGTITLSHAGNFNNSPAFTLARDSMSIFNPAADTTLPYIASSLPSNGAAGVGLTDSVRITFSEPVRKSGVSYNFAPNPGLVDTSWSTDSTTIFFSHSAFAGLTSYTVRVLGVQDTAYNPLAGIDSISFTTLLVDTNLPYISSSLPLNGATGVGLSDSVRITFSEPVRKSGVSYTFAPNPGLVDTVWSADSSSIAFNHSAFAGLTSYTVRVLGVQDTMGNVLTGRDSIGFITMPAPDTIPPAVVLVSPSTGATGVLLQQQIVVNFSEPMDTASFRFRCSPDPLTWNLAWSSGDSQVTLGHGDFTPSTLYSFRVDSAADKSGNPMLNPPYQWSFTTVLPDSMSFNLAGGTYQMFSVPLSPVDSTPAQILGDELGAYSDSTWRIFGYKPSLGYLERPNISSGQGYWLATAGNALVEVKGTRFMNFFNQPIDSGWNLIGDPFDTTVTLANALVLWNDTASHFVNFTDSTVNSVVRQRMYNWRDASPDFVNNGVWDSLTPYNAGDQMHPWMGYALYAVRPCTLMMERFMGKRSVGQVKAPQYQVNWQLVMDVASGKTIDRDLKLGVSPQAEETYDRLDAEKPPLISNTVKAYFPHQDWNQGPCQEYQQDFRPNADYIEWPMTIEVAKADQPVVLSAQITGELGNGGNLYLLNRRTGKTFDLKIQKTVGFSGSQELAVVYSTRPFDSRTLTPLSFGLGRIGPNPFRQSAVINYQLPQAGPVSMAVYNITGQKVRNLVSQNMPPGYYSQAWDGRNDGGRALSAGIYIIRLSASGKSAAQKIVKLQ